MTVRLTLLICSTCRPERAMAGIAAPALPAAGADVNLLRLAGTAPKAGVDNRGR